VSFLKLAKIVLALALTTQPVIIRIDNGDFDVNAEIFSMNKSMTRILTLLSGLVIVYASVVMLASIVQLADAADRIHLGAGKSVFWALLTTFVLFLLTPVVIYFRLPRPLIPPADKSEPLYEEFMTELRYRMRANPRLKNVRLDSSVDIPAAIEHLSRDADGVIRETASVVFVGSAVMQNGRLDGLIILFTQVRMVWQIASIYYQRPSPRQMLYLYSNVGATALLADSIQEIEFSELVAPLVVSIFPSLKGAVPGLQGISTLLVNSLANGAANAFLTLRVGIVARQYCESTTTPSRNEVRQSATVSALALVGQITKENGARIVQGSWSAVRDAVEDAVDSTVQGVRGATGRMVDATVTGVRGVVDSIASTARGAKQAAIETASQNESSENK
jgi:hypothetical protein